MKYIFKTHLLVLLLFLVPAEASAQLVINEIMQSNIENVFDELNDFPDSWLELYNAGEEPIALSGYSIGTTSDAAAAFALPSATIGAGSHVMIYCDKVGEGYHTDFRLDSGKGGSVYLFRNGVVVDKIENWKKQPAPNIAYGRESDNAIVWGYQAVPTPGSTNCGKLCNKILPDPIFSDGGKIFTGSFRLMLSIPDNAPEGTVIRFTLTGEEPTERSPEYIAPIAVADNLIVRAKLFCEGYLSPRSITHSYIAHHREVMLPVISIVGDRDYFYDNSIGILVEGTFDSEKPNFEYDWRRPVNLEYFDSREGECLINQLCETRVKGGASRVCPLKSMAVYANKRFGTKRFDYEFFPDQTPGIKEFKSFELRNAGNDFYFMYMRDAIIQRSMGGNADLDWQPSRPVIFYINGVYKGILNLRPRSNEDYVYSYYDGLEDIDMIENWWELKSGTFANFNAFRTFYNEEGHSMEEYDALMDTGEFCNQMILRLFFDDRDFPGNNIVMWRPREAGGRWRWVVKDTDGGLGLHGKPYDYPTLTWLVTPGFDNNNSWWANREEHTLLFRRLLEIPEFRDMFIDRSAIYLGDFLTPAGINGIIDDRFEEIKVEHEYHQAINYPYGNSLDYEVKAGKTWLLNRWNFFYGHLASFFQLGSPVDLSVGTGDRGEDHLLMINNVALRSGGFKGKYFSGRKLKIQSVAASYVDGSSGIKGWEVRVTIGGKTTTEVFTGDVLSIEMPISDSVEILPLFEDDIDSAVKKVTEDFNQELPFDIYDIAGRYVGRYVSLENLNPGIYILRQNEMVRKVFVK